MQKGRQEEIFGGIEVERKRNGMTKEELSKELGVSLKTYYNWINEDTDIPSSALLRMSEIFGVSIDHLLKENKEKS